MPAWPRIALCVLAMLMLARDWCAPLCCKAGDPNSLDPSCDEPPRPSAGQLQPDGLRLPSVNRCSSEQSLADGRGTMHKAAQPECQQNVSLSLHVEEAASPCEVFLNLPIAEAFPGFPGELGISEPVGTAQLWELRLR